jgi:uncharacterized 2Fe-2S/4Fe-4S cluster protein (DUF4445 family)
MVVVSFRCREGGRPVTRQVRVAAGTPLLEAARCLGLPVARGCGGDGLCGRCGLEVLEGAAALSPESAEETRARRRNRGAEGLRLACRARAEGAVTATASYW